MKNFSVLYLSSELRQTLGVTLVESIVEQILQDLTEAQDKMVTLTGFALNIVFETKIV